jgi:hypothetical protein
MVSIVSFVCYTIGRAYEAAKLRHRDNSNKAQTAQKNTHAPPNLGNSLAHPGKKCRHGQAQRTPPQCKRSKRVLCVLSCASQGYPAVH